MPGVSVAFVGLFHEGVLELVVEEPEDVPGYLSVLVPLAAGRPVASGAASRRSRWRFG